MLNKDEWESTEKLMEPLLSKMYQTTLSQAKTC